MESSLSDEWILFEQKSLNIFRSLNIKGVNKQSLFKIIERPSLCWDCLRRWELYEEYVVRIDWFCQDDLKKFSSVTERAKYPKEINPTIKYKISNIQKEFSESVINELSNISIPLNTKRKNFGCDGTDYEIEVGNYFSRITISWWEDAPEQWKAIGDFTKKIMVEIDKLLINEEYIDSLSFSGKLWLIPTPNNKITKELVDFLKQFSEFAGLNVIQITEIFKYQKAVLLDSKYDYLKYINIKSEFSKYGLDVEFLKEQ